ncbi:glycosyltransferase [Actinomycetospora endophytica]|uniref:Glycosyltransferase n=1 Tax=Actinomycetospora endophytica TaxID=2291215 RepID=A0ABS8PCU2_9PSEU|nr:glycosyltransferase [Actinomycetospora endophytica]MCD2196101.1 glycosyltransferase [Actinomycetospora endophytica]
MTVVIACFDLDRWPITRRAVESALSQDRSAPPIVVVDHNEELYALATRWCGSDVVVLRNEMGRGASGARNTGVRAARTELVAFLDDDAIASPTWLSELVEPVRDPSVVGVGGAIEPAWSGETGQGGGVAPRWFPTEFGWTVGATATPAAGRHEVVRNVWSGNMLVRKDVFLRAGGFRDDFGKVAGAREPEDTELCLRMSAVSDGGRWCLLGGARVDHHVPASRQTRTSFLRRCWAEGVGKAALSAVAQGGTAALTAEQDYLTRTVPRALVARGRETLRGDLAAPDQAGMIVAGVAAAGAGFLTRRLRGLRAPADRNADAGRAPTPSEGLAAEPAPDAARIVEVEVGAPLPRLERREPESGQDYPGAHVLVRLATEPIGVVQAAIPPSGLPPEQLADLIWRQLSSQLLERCPSLTSSRLTSEGVLATECSAYLDERAATLADAPPITVVVCTKDPDERILACLSALDAQEYPEYEVVVVDNAPRSDMLIGMMAQAIRSAPARRVVEPVPGVARARNLGWRAADGAIVAYIDDDEVADPHWLAEIARALRRHPSASALTGKILPAVLDTEAQCWFEKFGGHGKGRGFSPVVFDPASHRIQHPLYPLPSFGASGNMAVRRHVLAELGGFDNALGPGTPALGSEDTAFLSDLMLAGHTLVYWPGAVVRHRHYEDWSGISRQFYGYGLGLGAFYTRAVLNDPRRLIVLSRLAPTALREMAGRRREGGPRGEYPMELDRLERRGLYRGPVQYLRSRHEARRITVERVLVEA